MVSGSILSLPVAKDWSMQANPILLQRKYARIVKLFAEQTGLTYEQALDFFYNSKTYELISEGIADMHCLSDEYLAEELLIEKGGNTPKSTP
jgi:hypothetical protein